MTAIDAPNTTVQDHRRAASISALLAGYLLTAAYGVILVDRLCAAPQTLGLFGLSLHLGRLHIPALAATRVLLVIPAILTAELCLVGWRQSSLYRLTAGGDASSRTDLAYFVCVHLQAMGRLNELLTLGVALISGLWLHQALRNLTGLDLSIAAWPLAAQVGVFALIYSFCDYWSHRLDHTALFWPLHRYHHAATEFCVINSARVHPAIFTAVLINAAPIALIAVSPEAVIDAGLYFTALRFLIHSRLDADFGWLGRWLIQSPRRHRLHHIRDMSQPIAHYSLAPIWDRLFGTWREDPDHVVEIGVATPYRHGTWIGPDLWRDYCEFWRGIAAPAVRLLRRRRAGLA